MQSVKKNLLLVGTIWQRVQYFLPRKPLENQFSILSSISKKKIYDITSPSKVFSNFK